MTIVRKTKDVLARMRYGFKYRDLSPNQALVVDRYVEELYAAGCLASEDEEES